MSSYRSLSLFLLAIIVFKQVSSQQYGIINISLKDSKTGLGIPGSIYVFDGSSRKSFITKKYGKLSFEGIVGLKEFEISSKGYKTLYTHFTLNAKDTLSVDVLLDSENEFIFKTLSPGMALISGHIINKATGAPVRNAKVSVSGMQTTVTNNNGYYELPLNGTILLEKDENFEFDLIVQKNGYTETILKNLFLTLGQSIINVDIKKGAGWEIRNFQHKLNQQLEYEFLQDTGPAIDSLVSKSLACPIPHVSIRVGLSCQSGCNNPCTDVQVMSLESYVETGVGNEWRPGWHMESLKAGAVAYRTVGAWRVKNPRSPNFDIRNDACDQAWNSNIEPNCASAARATAGEMITDASNRVVKSEYSAENNNAGCGDGFSGTNTTWPCIEDAGCKGKPKNGHGRGMCQQGSQYWAKDQGKQYTWILSHYYEPGKYKLCK